MTKLSLVPAVRTRARARVALVGPSKSGKTFSALAIARGLVGPEGRIAVIDSEHGSASIYAGRVTEFEVVELAEDHSPATYIDALDLCAAAGVDVVVVDSLSHAWAGRNGALEMVDQIAGADRSGNKWAAWAKVTPECVRLVERILAMPCHVVATMRTKTAWTQEEYTDARGRVKTRPVKIGLEPIQRADIEYEFGIVGELDVDHLLRVSGSRFEEIDGAEIPRPGIEFGEQLRALFEDGADPLARWRAEVEAAEAAGTLGAYLGADGLQARAAVAAGAWAVEARELVDASLCRLVASAAPELARRAVLTCLGYVEACADSDARRAANKALSTRLDALDALDAEADDKSKAPAAPAASAA